MRKEELASLLNGNDYRNEITKDLAKQAKENGLVVVYGASDDLCEFEGAIYDEAGCYDGGDIFFTKTGKFPTEEHLEAIAELESDLDIKIDLPLNKIRAVFCPQTLDCSWAYETEIPHATFDIMEDGELYCRGIVFSINDLK